MQQAADPVELIRMNEIATLEAALEICQRMAGTEEGPAGDTYARAVGPIRDACDARCQDSD